MTRVQTALPIALVALAGCGVGSNTGDPHALGRAVGAEPTQVTQAPAPAGDPSAERGGTVPRGKAGAQNKLAPGSSAATPRVALLRYALAYTNWQARSLAAHERELGLLAVGSARLVAQQTAASQSAIAELARYEVENKGSVLGIASGEGSARGWWVVMTQEQTTGTGRYAGLPASVHVTLARVARVAHGWAIEEWQPAS